MFNEEELLRLVNELHEDIPVRQGLQENIWRLEKELKEAGWAMVELNSRIDFKKGKIDDIVKNPLEMRVLDVLNELNSQDKVKEEVPF